MTPEQFIARCPSLWHVGPSGSWARIREYGIRTAAQLIDAADLDDDQRNELHQTPRREPVRLPVDGFEVVLRDQGPLLARRDVGSILADDLTVADWVGLLNRRVYLFTDRRPMETLLSKYVARDGAQEVYLLSSRRLVEAVRSRIELTDQNTGAIQRKRGVQKSRETFVPLARYPDRRPKEVTVVDGIDDLRIVVRVERVHADGTREPLHPTV